MKKVLFTLCLAVASVALFTSCSKDDEDKIVGTWEAYKYVDKYDGITETGTFKPGEFVVTCKDDGTFVSIYTEDGDVDIDAGKYTISDDILVLNFNGDSEPEIYNIDKLTKSELVISESYDDDKYTVYFKKK